MKVAYKWHGRLGWVFAPLLALQALGGAVLLWMQPLPALHESPPAAEAWAQRRTLCVAQLARRYPTARIEYVNLPGKTDAPVSVRLLASGSNESGWADIDAVNGTAGALQPDSSQARRSFMGCTSTGCTLTSDLGCCARWRCSHSCWSRWGCGSVARAAPPARTPLRGLHRLIGPVFVLPLAMMLVTGFVLRSPEWTRAALSAWPGKAAAAAKPAAPAAPAASGLPTATLGQALITAATALPQSRPIRIYPARNGVVRVRMRGDEWHPLGLDYVFVSTAGATVQRIVRAAEQPLSVRYLNVVYPLHLGWLPGNPGLAGTLVMRGLWTLLAFVTRDARLVRTRAALPGDIQIAGNAQETSPMKARSTAMKAIFVPAVLVTSLAGTAFAQSNVSLSGGVDLALAHGSGSISNSNQLAPNYLGASRLALKGFEDLGGGLKAGFWIESWFNADTGTGQNTNTNNQSTGAAGGGGLTWNRRSHVSLGGDWGEIRLGRDFTPQYMGLAVLDPFDVGGSGTIEVLNSSIVGPTAVRASNSISYLYGHGFNAAAIGYGPRGFAGSGFQFHAMYYLGENPSGTPTSKDGTGYGARRLLDRQVHRFRCSRWDQLRSGRRPAEQCRCEL